MILYPLENWDSFCSVADANTIIEGFVSQGSWGTLTDPQKEAYLKQSTLLISNRVFELPSSLETSLQLATCYLSAYSIGKDMLTDDGKSNIKRVKIEGAIEKEFFTKATRSDAFPSIVNGLLEMYGLSSNNSFKLDRA